MRVVLKMFPRSLWFLVLALGGAGLIEPAVAQRGEQYARTAAKPAVPSRLPLAPAKAHFDLRDREDLARLVDVAEALVQLSETQETESERREKELRAQTPFTEMTLPELKAYFSEPDDLITKKERRGLKEVRRLAAAILAENDPQLAEEHTRLLVEVMVAINNNRRPPADPKVELVELPFIFFDYLRNPICHGDTPAANVPGAAGDRGVFDPAPSTFWTPVKDIAAQDLYAGFGRADRPALEDKLWSYRGPKTSYGGCPGFEAAFGKIKLKVKFGEIHSEPFTARIFAALGYHVEPTDYVPRLKLQYDRRFLREFHLRKDIQMRVYLFHLVPLRTIDVQHRYDPFDFITAAVMKDGTRLSGAEFKRRLFHDARRPHPEDWLDNFRPEVERQIDHLITRPANVQIEDDDLRSIGPWDFDRLGHEHRREIRAAGLAGAWVGWFDSRFENTRLKIVKTGRDQSALKHYLTDLGGGLGKTIGITSRCCESPNEFTWTFTRAPRPQGKGRMTIPFRIVSYEPIEETRAFKEMTVDDACWMARQIARLTEEQIVAALVASGLDSAQVRIFAEKLISRRDQMILDLELAEEFPLLRPWGVDRSFSYHPAVDGPVRIRTRQGREVVARDARLAVHRGRIFRLDDPERPYAGFKDCVNGRQ